ncbi:pseudouridine synthase [Mesorhizobium sp. ZC-5]|uniref:pseudouridine synthase n=1 Tax=Mesorhizobium sp. ZC-5 TaxID=2986066 RepID=UPI0021E7F592|nr:pseudouridine synthase [Mesorhizobium sp. ZC-5]MCV3242273.1 pseudouridine synthase [Mesorhizobium sp. ZC-5]
MDDERKKGPRQGGPKSPGGARGGERSARPGKPGFAGKPKHGGGPGKPASAGKPYAAGGKKPFQKRRDDSGDARGERPRPDFRREERPRTDGERPARPFAGKPRADGERKPFEKRPSRDVAGGERRFERGDRPAGERQDRRPRPSGGERKPFVRTPEVPGSSEGERIAKRLARAGIASRRDAEELIAAGRVRVNGKVLSSPAFNVSVNDTIELDGTTIPPIERTRLFLFHKPAGVVTTNRDPQGRKTVFEVLPKDLPRLMTVGRLDINTEGLLLLTNDGGLARVLELPATGWLRRYRVRVHGKPDEKALAELKNGIAVDGVFYGAIEASLDRAQGTNAWLTIGLREGKNREVKNILGALGLDVTRLIRISYGPFQLAELPEGHVWEMKGKTLRDQLGERLIEESGANFDAEIAKPFSNKPTRREYEPEEHAERPKIVRDGERGRIGEGGLIKNRKRRENTRDEALGKLSTSRPERPKFDRGDRPERPKVERGERPERAAKFGDRPDRFATFADKPGKPELKPRAGKKPEREQRPIEPPGQRKANVWMAPGARPIGKGRAEAEKHDAEARKDRKPKFGKPGGKPGFGKPRGERLDGGKGGDRPRSDGPKGPRGGARNADRRR